MDISGYVSNNVTLEQVRASQTKTVVLLNSGIAKTFPDGKTKISFLVEMDGKTMDYTPNRTTLGTLVRVFGKETTLWVGKKIKLEQGVVNNKDAIIGIPMAT